MKELTSYQLDLSKNLSSKEITSLYEFVSTNKCDLYLYQKGHIADAQNFPKLISFFLLSSIKEPLVVIIDGEKPEEIFQRITNLLNQHVKRSIIRKRHQTTENNSIVI